MNPTLARKLLSLVPTFALLSILASGPSAFAEQGDCGQPISDGPSPVASDCLFILNAAVGVTTCEPECICDLNATPPVTSTDALICLSVSVGNPPSDFPKCPCVSTTTTTTSTTTTTLGGPTECGAASVPTCDGACGSDEACRPGIDGCFCEKFRCGDYTGAPLCYGLCPEGEQCVIDGNDCQCVPSAIMCNTAEQPQCNGDCSAGTFCGMNEDIGQCVCFVTACGDLQPAPVCWGVCPVGSSCKDIDSACQCVSNSP